MKLKKANKPAQSKLNDSYTLIPDPNDKDQWLVELKKEPWTGIIYKYVSIKPIEDAENDRLIVQMQYDILEVPEDIKNREFPDEMDAEFNKLIGDIVVELVEEEVRQEQTLKQVNSTTEDANEIE